RPRGGSPRRGRRRSGWLVRGPAPAPGAARDRFRRGRRAAPERSPGPGRRGVRGGAGVCALRACRHSPPATRATRRALVDYLFERSSVRIREPKKRVADGEEQALIVLIVLPEALAERPGRSEEHTSELQSR